MKFITDSKNNKFELLGMFSWNSKEERFCLKNMLNGEIRILPREKVKRLFSLNYDKQFIESLEGEAFKLDREYFDQKEELKID